MGSDRVYSIDAPGAGSDRKYTTGLTVNGTPQTASWLDEDFAREGGNLTFTMSATPGAWGTGANDVPPSYTDGMNARNNIGTTDNGAANMGSMDLSDWSFSRQNLASAGAAPGDKIPYINGLGFTWPDTQPGEPDNWIPAGQRIEMGGVTAGSLSFLGLATNGPSVGTAVVEYSDGSTQNVRVEVADWGSSPAAGGATLVTVGGRNSGSGSYSTGTFRVFGTRPALLDVTKKVQAVILPQSTDRGIMHIFDVAVSEQEYIDPSAPKGEPERVILTGTNDASTSQFVTWRSRSTLPLTGKVEVRAAGGGATTTVSATQQPERSIDGYPSRTHSARLADLKPATAYEYRVASGSNWSPWYAFTTASASAEPFTFLYFGDGQKAINTVFRNSVEMAMAANPDSGMSLFAGDMINTATVESEWRDWFSATESMRTQSNMQASLGNHEIGGQPRIENFTDNFEYEANGPVVADAKEYAPEFGALLERVLKDTVYYTDHQGVRFITINGNRNDICTLVTTGTTSGCDVGKQAWMTAQATWLDRVLKQNPGKWSVVTSHQPVLSSAIVASENPNERDEKDWRGYIMPVVAQQRRPRAGRSRPHLHAWLPAVHGHVHERRDRGAGVCAGKQRAEALPAVPRREQHVDPQRGRAGQTRTGRGELPVGEGRWRHPVVQVGRHLHRFGSRRRHERGRHARRVHVTKREDGAKWVTEPGVAVPGPEVPPVNVDQPSDVPFDAATYGQVAFDDDFSTDRLSEYSVFGDEGENPSDYSVDTTAGVLNSSSTSRKWTNFALPATGGSKFAVIVEPKTFVSGVLPEDTLFVGSTDGPGNAAYSWYHNGRTSSGLHVYKGGQRQELSQSPTGKTVSWQPGDRFATVFDNGQMTSYIEKNGVWEPIRSGALQLTLTREQINSWTPSFGIRQDGGAIAIDRVTVLVPGEAPQPVEVTPAVVTFTDAAGTADDVYEIPVAQGVEYLVDGAPMGAGTYAGVGTVTVTARAVDGYVLADGAQTEWAFAFTDVPGTDPGTDPGTEPTPDAPSESDLTDANRGDLGISGPVVAGSALTVTVGASLAGKTVWAWLFSSPAALGSATVNAAGGAVHRSRHDARRSAPPRGGGLRRQHHRLVRCHRHRGARG